METRLSRPAREEIAAFLLRAAKDSFSYPEVGATATALPPGYAHIHRRERIGGGAAVFEAAREAILRWKMFPDWVEVFPASDPIAPGVAVAVLARPAGVYCLNACRIVYVVDEAGPPRRFGFAYGTLPSHAERGEERFVVEMDEGGGIWYDLSSFSRPGHWLVRLGLPFARRLQERFADDSVEAMRRAAGDTR